MSAKTLLLALIGLISLVSSLTIPADSDACETPTVENTEACYYNTRFVLNRRLKGDLSVVYSKYISVNQTFYEKNTLLRDISYLGTKPQVLPHDEPDNLVFSHADDPKIKEALSTSFGDADPSKGGYVDNNWYVIYAAIDLMNAMYTKVDKERNPSGYQSWRFSSRMVLDEIRDSDDRNNILYVMYYLESTGVCKEDEVTVSNCPRYRIDGYISHYQDPSNQALLDLVVVNPLYVQVGINPTYYQFHSPNSEEPIHSGHDQPTHCGVLTGYDLRNKGNEFWEIFIRRHGENYNRVKLGCVFEKNGVMQIPFAGITTKMIEIAVENTNPYQYEVVLKRYGEKIKTTQELKEYAERYNYTSDTQSIVLYEDLFDCSNNNYIPIYEVFNANQAVHKITIIGGDILLDFICLDVQNPVKEVDLTFISVEEYESEGGRRLGDMTLTEIDLLPSHDLDFANPFIRRLRFGNNLFNDKKYDLEISNCTSLKSIIIGDITFSYAWRFVLKNNPSLQQIVVGNSSLGGRPAMSGSELVLDKLPELDNLVLKQNAGDNFIRLNSNNVNNEAITIDGDHALNNVEEYEGNNISETLDDYFKSKLKVTPTPTAIPSQEPSL